MIHGSRERESLWGLANFRLTHLNEVAVDDGFAEGRVVHADLGLGRREVRLEVDADPPEAAQVVERRQGLELAEYALEFGLEETKGHLHFVVKPRRVRGHPFMTSALRGVVCGRTVLIGCVKCRQRGEV